jgi:antirestriction protein ArdC
MTAKTRKTSKPAIDVYQVVTDRIIAQLKAGTAPWQMPWNTTTGRPMNIDGRPYRGINVLLTGMSGYACPFWMTFNQMKAMGGNLKKINGADEKGTGQTGTMVVLWKILNVQDKDTGEDKTIFLLRHFTVFNLLQTEGVKVPQRVIDWQNRQTAEEHEPFLPAEEIVAAYNDGPAIRTDGAKAFYSPESDEVTVPPLSAYSADLADEYYSTLFHELAHSTGHKDRLDRFTGKGRAFGCKDYSREELVAEMTAAFLQAEAGIGSTEANSAAYIAGWLGKLKEDTKAVVVAAGAAQKAADRILGRSAVVADSTEKEMAA